MNYGGKEARGKGKQERVGGGREQKGEGQRVGDQDKGGKGESERGWKGINPRGRTSCRCRDENLEGLRNCEVAEQRQKLLSRRSCSKPLA